MLFSVNLTSDFVVFGINTRGIKGSLNKQQDELGKNDFRAHTLQGKLLHSQLLILELTQVAQMSLGRKREKSIKSSL